MATVKGLDTVSDVSNIVSTIKNAGYSFVVRYYSLESNSKRMSTSESAAISGAGLKRLVVYQNVHNAVSKFSATIAAGDASDAISQAKSHGQATGSTIFFAVDYDAPEEDIDGSISEHFKVLYDTVVKAGYLVGVYGSSLVCKKLKEAGLVSKTWLSMSTAHGFGTFFEDWDLHQTSNVTLGGISFDEDETNSFSTLGTW